MKRICIGMCGLLLLGVVGCTGGTTGGQTTGGAGSDASLTIDPPNTATTLKPGETKEITLNLKKGKDYKGDLELTFSEPPKGISFEPDKITVKEADKEVKFKVKATNDAPEGKHTITATAKQKTGEPAANKFDVEVKK